jgi:hypothetical protein
MQEQLQSKEHVGVVEDVLKEIENRKVLVFSRGDESDNQQKALSGDTSE